MKKLFNSKRIAGLAATLALAAGTAMARYTPAPDASGASEPRADLRAQSRIFNRLELGLNVGTTGLGIEVGTPVTRWVRVRAGLDWIPRFNIPMHFDLTAYTDDGTSGPVTGSNFDRVQELMNELTGFDMDKRVTMQSKPTVTTFRLLADVYPFDGKGWRVTAGFFAGGKTVGRSINDITEMPTLLCVGMYNKLYDYAKETEIWDFTIPVLDVNLDPDVAQELKDKLEHYGRLGIHIGDFKDGTPYIMEPDKDGTVSARAIVNAIRPYVGIGYDGTISRDGRWNIGFDLGAQFWGGAPKVVTHENVDLTELINVRGKVGDYLKLMRGLPVYPTAAFRLTYTFF